MLTHLTAAGKRKEYEHWLFSDLLIYASVTLFGNLKLEGQLALDASFAPKDVPDKAHFPL